MDAEPTAEQIAIANLAVQMLPKIDLPDAWGTMHPDTLGKHISEPTTGKGVNFSESYESPQGWATPWELISEEAVKRARVLMDAAAGNKRQERIDYENSERRSPAADGRDVRSGRSVACEVPPLRKDSQEHHVH